MKATGERFIPNANMGNELEVEHMHRYRAAVPLVKGLHVLDAACGVGYGTAMMAESAAHVTGIDISSEAISYAKELCSSANVDFSEMSVENLDFPNESFDAVISFETIEHVSEEIQKLFLSEVKRVLKPNGFFIVSTPDLDVMQALGHGNYVNPYHIKEYNAREFEALLREYFPCVTIHHQNNVMCSVIDGAYAAIPPRIDPFTVGQYLIAACSMTPRELSLGSTFCNFSNFGTNCMFYVDCGKGFCEESKAHVVSPFNSKGDFTAYLDLGNFAGARSVRFDPCDSPCKVDHIAANSNIGPIRLDPTGETFYDADKCVFMHSDPNYLLTLSPTCDIQWIEVHGRLELIRSEDAERYWLSRTSSAVKQHEQDKSDISNQKKQLCIAKDTIAAKDLEIARSREAIDSKDTEINAARDTIDSLEEQLVAAQNTISEKDLEISRSREAIDDLQNQIQIAQKTIYDKDMEIEAARNAMMHKQ